MNFPRILSLPYSDQLKHRDDREDSGEFLGYNDDIPKYNLCVDHIPGKRTKTERKCNKTYKVTFFFWLNCGELNLGDRIKKEILLVYYK